MDPSDFLHTPQAQALGSKEQVMKLLHSPEAQQLSRLLRQVGGSQLQTAAQAAMQGDPQQLSRIFNQVMATPEGARTVEQISQTLPK